MKNLLLSLLAVLCCCTVALAKEKPDSYAMQRAMECIEEGDLEKAQIYFEKELVDNPNNVKALSGLSVIYNYNDNYGKALELINRVISLTNKKDKKDLATNYAVRSSIYLAMEDTVPAINDLRMAIKLNPEEEEYVEDIANLYYLTDRFDESDDMYRRMLDMNPINDFPYLGLARNAYSTKRFDEAREYVAKARALDPENNMTNIVDMRISLNEEDWKGTVDRALVVLDNQTYNREAIYTIVYVADSAYTYTVRSLKKRSFTDRPNRTLWNIILSDVYSNAEKYYDAIDLLESLTDDEDYTDAIFSRLIECYHNIDRPDQVIKITSEGLESDLENASYLFYRGNAYLEQLELDLAIEDFETSLENEPSAGSSIYYCLAHAHSLQGDYKKALEDIEMSIILDEEDPASYVYKGFLLRDRMGRAEEAQETFEECLDLFVNKKADFTKAFALAGVGRADEAIAIADSICTAEPDGGNFYNLACLYSRMHDKDNALKALRTSLEKGYRQLHHIAIDSDIDYLRDMPEYNALIEEFRPKQHTIIDVVPDNVEKETVVYEVPLVRQRGGTYLIKASVNDLPMDFILDTGCSDVSLSSLESDFMLKNGYLKPSDMGGMANYVTASGDVHTSRQVNLARIRIGELEVTNIGASIVSNQQAPLLLGQKVLNKFGKVEIDHKKSVLRITVTK